MKMTVGQLLGFIFTTIIFFALTVFTVWYWIKKKISGNALFLGVWNYVWATSISYDAMSLPIGYHRALIAIHITMNAFGVIFFLIRAFKKWNKEINVPPKLLFTELAIWVFLLLLSVTELVLRLKLGVDNEGFQIFAKSYPVVVSLTAVFENGMTKLIEIKAEQRKSVNLKQVETRFAELMKSLTEVENDTGAVSNALEAFQIDAKATFGITNNREG